MSAGARRRRSAADRPRTSELPRRAVGERAGGQTRGGRLARGADGSHRKHGGAKHICAVERDRRGRALGAPAGCSS